MTVPWLLGWLFIDDFLSMLLFPHLAGLQFLSSVFVSDCHGQLFTVIVYDG